jgi:dTDP-4-dehydrorhamnose reductase
MLYNRVLITGANGLVGQALVRRMSRFPEYDVLATSRDDEPRFSGGSCGYSPLDVTNPDEVEAIFQDFTPNVVVNCAAMSDAAACADQRETAWAVNAGAVQTLARCCRSTGARLVQVSTDFVFDGKDGPYEEDARPNPVNDYGRTKLAGENAVREAGPSKWAIARTVLVYGTADGPTRSNVVLWVLNNLLQNEPLHVVDDQWRTPTYVEDLAAGIERMIHFEKTGIYHLSGRELLTVYDLACQVADVFDLDDSLIHPVSSDYFEDAIDRPPKTGFLILKAESEIGYKPRSLEDGLRHLGRRLDHPVTS